MVKYVSMIERLRGDDRHEHHRKLFDGAQAPSPEERFFRIYPKTRLERDLDLVERNKGILGVLFDIAAHPDHPAVVVVDDGSPTIFRTYLFVDNMTGEIKDIGSPDCVDYGMANDASTAWLTLEACARVPANTAAGLAPRSYELQVLPVGDPITDEVQDFGAGLSEDAKMILTRSLVLYNEND